MDIKFKNQSTAKWLKLFEIVHLDDKNCKPIDSSKIENLLSSKLIQGFQHSIKILS